MAKHIESHLNPNSKESSSAMMSSSIGAKLGRNLVILTLFLCISRCGANYIVNTFEATGGDDVVFNHLVVHDYTSIVYIGAVNRLYQLSDDLQLVKEAITGPKEDNYDCPVSRICPPGVNKKLMNNWNKALLIDYSHAFIIACGSLFQGICTVHKLDNVSSSQILQNEPVVANNATASTVAFIAPGPVKRPETHVMYVGVTFTNNGAYRSDVPAVSSRSLAPGKIFKIASTTVTTATRLRVNSLAREHYFITYVYGFSSSGYGFFVTYQKQDTEKSDKYISKLIRICQNDTHYYSYTEIPLVCRGADGTDYNLVQAAYLGKPGSDLAVELGITAQDEVLFAVFAKSLEEIDQYNKPGKNSALCLYSIKDIQLEFKKNIQNCFYGKGMRGLGFVNPSKSCVLTQIIIKDDFCGVDVNTPLGGSIPIEAEPVLTFRNTLLTAVASISTHIYTVVLLGTSDGHLKKVVVESQTSAFDYDDLVIDEGSKVNADLTFDRSKKHIYVMTERKINRIKLQDCSRYKTCGECLGAKDPYCGWCSLENKCSLLGDCSQVQKGQKSQTTWQAYNVGRCTTITSVSPHQIQRTTVRKLELQIDNLPELPGPFVCTFTINEKVLETRAERSQGGLVVCPTPLTDDLPKIPANERHFTAILSVRQKEGPDYVATNFTFFDCNSYPKCTECVSCPFPCNWCVEGNRCTHDTGENCRSETLVTGINEIGPSSRSGPGFCPRINTTYGSSAEILVPSGMSKNISVVVESPRQLNFDKKYLCVFNIGGRFSNVPGRKDPSKNVVHCDSKQFNFNSPHPNITAKFTITWDHNKELDNPRNIHVVVYRCRDMAENCGMCISLPPKYNCGWCSNTERCEVKEQCGSSSRRASWLKRGQTCPNPEILSFQPTSGPFEGGTNITIHGKNLGQDFSDIENGITVANIPCIPYKKLYRKTTTIVCKVGNPQVPFNEPVSGKVIVSVLKKYRGVSPYNYQYVNPVITSIFPLAGPIAGGTRLEIRGEYMDAGSQIFAFLGDRLCSMIRTSRNISECLTPPGKDYYPVSLSMHFDAGKRTFNNFNFAYKRNPTITLVYAPSDIPGNEAPRGIPGGGISIMVSGENLDVIVEPKFYVTIDGVEYINNCDIIPSQPARLSRMKCKSPVIDSSVVSFDSEHKMVLDYGFIMDNVTELRNYSRFMTNKKFHLHPNPVFVIKDRDYNEQEQLFVDVKHLSLSTSKSDVVVMVGDGICNVTAVNDNSVTCKPPTTAPNAIDDQGNIRKGEVPRIIVKVGDNMKYEVGHLNYNKGDEDSRLPQMAIIWLCISAGVLVAIVVIILIAYKRKMTESNRVLKNMQEQLDILELRVASECKEAFAELQTEMTDLTSDVTSSGIPFLDYRTYAMKILFPNVEDHAVLREFDLPMDPMKKNQMDKGLRLFGQLIMNKTFLLIFIRTLESNRYFSMRDRVNVASLIMVTLQGKMEYCSDIQKTLLAELIEKCIDGKSHPKLLLRRTESVAEKMLSAWFTFLLYKFLKECAGEPLFLLYRAIKQQIDKGPVDSISHEARYSLSEEKLIRQSIVYKPMNVFVSMYPQAVFNPTYDPNAEILDISVKVLDCDTISQVKEKALDTIYKYHPYSQRPFKEDLDLEWRTGSSGRLILSDEDATTQIDGEWKRLNTLAHYKVPDGALLTLVTKQSSIYNQTILSDKSDKSHKYETLNFSFKTSSPPTSRATSPLNHDSEAGYKLWHLVKHHDGDHQKEGYRGNKMVSEIYLTRLLATKGTLQKFVDDLFETIFSTAHRGSALPLAIKYMFDFLDDQALQHGIQDDEVVHTWKSNSLPLRFWVNLIKNPNFVFDISKSNIVDSCLSVVAQTFMDSCSTSEHRLGKDSPSSKLLYAKDIPIYKQWVERYYQDIKMMPSISDQDMNAMLAEESRMHMNEFNTQSALHELYSYAVKYNDQLNQALEEDEFSNKNRLAYKLEQVHSIMSGESDA